MDEPMVDPEFDEAEMDNDDGWEEDDEWLMAPVTPPRAIVTILSTYEVGGPSTATTVGHPLAIMAPGVATQPQTLQTALHGVELQNQQLLTRVAKMESREGTMMSYMLWMEERLTILEKRLPGPSLGPQIMPPKAMSEARMRKVIKEQVAASMAEFMANINRGAGGDEAGGAGAGGTGTGGVGADGAEAGGTETGGARVGGAGPAAPEITSDCKERDKVKFATATIQGRALTWWNGRIASMGINADNGTP
ncbi:hypothetical protein Tco_1276001 [Tanacetum coccineum]